MKNFRLQILLDNIPLNNEDKCNICIIFEALSFSRQQEILDNWDWYIEQFLQVRKSLDECYIQETIDTLRQANYLLDEALIREQEKESYKAYKKQKIRQELESTVAYWQLQKLKRIKEISKTPV